MNLNNNLLIHQNYFSTRFSCNRKTVSFGSKNSPVEPFTINSQKGPFFVEELKATDEIEALKFKTNFYVTTFPSWAKAFPDKKSIFNFFQETQRRSLKKSDENTTILIAKNLKGKIMALFSLEQYDYFYDSKVGYIRDCLVSKKYRSQGIGEILLGKILQTAKGNFTDVYLESEPTASIFYDKNGFKRLDNFNTATKKLLEYITNIYSLNEGVIPMFITINAKNPWWERYTKYIN